MDAEQWLILPEDVALAAGVFSGLLRDCTFLPTGPSWSLQPQVVLSCHEHLRSSSSPHILLRHCYDGTIEPDIMYSKVSVGNTVKTGLLFLPLFYFSKNLNVAVTVILLKCHILSLLCLEPFKWFFISCKLKAKVLKVFIPPLPAYSTLSSIDHTLLTFSNSSGLFAAIQIC